MKLCAIYNVWDDWDMLDHSIRNIKPLVDGIIVIGSTKSNFGEVSEIPERWKDKVIIVEPDLSKRPADNETYKRNAGLNMARSCDYTHFLMMDADEFYEPQPFLKEKERFKDPYLNGLVCGSQVYLKSPHLTIGMDTTRVPFIHKITPDLRFEWNKKYPFAWDNGSIRIDPTRQLNINQGVQWSEIIMHHYSWVRSDYEKKVRNSTARINLERSTIRQDLMLAKDGYFVNFYQKTLIRASVDFNIPDVQDDKKPLAAENPGLS